MLKKSIELFSTVHWIDRLLEHFRKASLKMLDRILSQLLKVSMLVTCSKLSKGCSMSEVQLFTDNIRHLLHQH
jgi:hypothetical protein